MQEYILLQDKGISVSMCSWASLGHPLYKSFVFIKYLTMNDYLLHKSIANIHEENGYGSSALECISPRFP